MIKHTLQYCATDKEIFDALMSGRQKISERILLDLGRDRGIFYSDLDSRESLVSAISLLPHDYHDLNTILEQRENLGRTEKLTSVTLPVALTTQQIKEVLKEYSSESPDDERVTFHSKGDAQVVANVRYSEVDYARTRLIQRSPREGGIEFHMENDKTIIRMPANERLKGIFGKLKDKLEGQLKVEIPTVSIEIGEFDSTLRTEFFTSLIGKLTGFQLENVTSVKVERLRNEDEETGLQLEDDQESEQAAQEALSLVKKVALRGETLLASEEYQNLAKKGFFITSIIWRSKQKKAPFLMVEFEAAFEHPDHGTGFKYSVRGAFKMVDKQYTKTMRPLSSENKEEYLALIEDTAAKTIKALRKKAKEIAAGGD